MLTGPFLSDYPALKSRWGETSSHISPTIQELITTKLRTNEVKNTERENLKTIKPNSKCTSWNDRRSRRVFLCFYSAIFQLTSAKFQTFAYNLRTVGSSYMKFGQQFEINELYVCTKF